MLNRFLYRLLPVFLSASFTIVSCGPSPEEKARKQALRDSASIDSALKKEVEAAHEKAKEKSRKTAFQKDSLNKVRKAKLDSVNLVNNGTSESSNVTPGISTTGHRDSLIKGLIRSKTHRDSLFAGLIRKKTHRDSLFSGLIRSKTHRDSLFSGLIRKKTHRDSIIVGLIRKKIHRDSLFSGLIPNKNHRDSLILHLVRSKNHLDSLILGQVHKKPLSHLDSVRIRHRRDSIRKAKLTDTGQHPK